MSFFGAAWMAEDADHAWRDDIRAALDATGLSDKEIADCLGVSKGKLSDMLNLRAQWSGWRERRLPAAYHVTLYKRRLARWQAQVIDSAELLELIRAVRSMAKMALPAERKTGTNG